MGVLMPLEPRYIDIPFGLSGTSEGRMHEHIIEPPRNYITQNAEITEAGLIRPRAGYVATSNTVINHDDLSEPYRLFKYKGNAAALEPDRIAVYSKDNDAWNASYHYRNLISSESWLLEGGLTYNITWWDCCVKNGYLFATYRAGSSGCYITVYDLSTRTIVRSQILSGSARFARVLAAGSNDRVWIVANSSSLQLNLSYIVATPAGIDAGWASGGSISTTVFWANFDACSDGSSVYVACQSYSANNIRLTKVVGISGAQSYSSLYALGATDYETISISHMGSPADYLLVAVCDGTDVAVECFNATNGYPVSGTTDSVTLDVKEMSSFVNSAGTSFGLLLSYRGSAPWNDYIALYTVSRTTDALTLVDTFYNVSLVHKAYGGNTGDEYDTVRFGMRSRTTEGTLIITAEYSGYLVKPVAVYSRYIAAYPGDSNINNDISGVGIDDDGSAYFLFPGYCKDDGGISGGLFQPTGEGIIAPFIGRYCEDNTLRGNSVEAQNVAVLSGGHILAYDGKDTFPLTFMHSPDIRSITPSAGGNLIESSTYLYIAIYEWFDNQGNRYQSKPSNVYTATMGAGETQNSIEVSQLTDFIDETAKVILYRTVSNGTVFYRLFPDTETNNQSDITYDYATITDDIDDDDITTNEYPYTYGGVLENTCAPSSDCMCVHKNRLWLVDNDTGYIWYSKEFVPKEGISFTESFVIQTDDQYNRPIWLESMDDYLIVFWYDKIGIVYGDGPNDLGQGGTFTLPRIVSKIGMRADSRRATIKTDDGIMFVSNDGIKLLDKSLAVSDIGADVSLWVLGSQYMNAGFSPNYHHVIFSRNVTSSNNVVTVIYDTELKQWYYNTVLVSDTADLVDALVIDDWHFLLKSAGTSRVYYKDYGASSPIYYDHSATDTINMLVTTPWIKIGDMQGFKRIWRALILGERYGIHQVTVYVYYDYDTSSYDTISIAYADTNVTPYQLKIGMPKQKVQSVQYKIYVQCPSGQTQNALAGLTSLRLEYGVDPRNIYRKKVTTHTLS